MGQPVYVMQNGRSLGSREFCAYFEKKVMHTISKFKMLGNNSFQAKGKRKEIIEKALEKYLVNGTGKKTIFSDECLDDAAENILFNLFQGKSKGLLPKDKKAARPLYFISEKEIGIYARLNGIKLKASGKSEIKDILNKLEEAHKEIKYSIVNSFLQIGA